MSFRRFRTRSAVRSQSRNAARMTTSSSTVMLTLRKNAPWDRPLRQERGGTRPGNLSGDYRQSSVSLPVLPIHDGLGGVRSDPVPPPAKWLRCQNNAGRPPTVTDTAIRQQVTCKTALVSLMSRLSASMAAVTPPAWGRGSGEYPIPARLVPGPVTEESAIQLGEGSKSI